MNFENLKKEIRLIIALKMENFIQAEEDTIKKEDHVSNNRSWVYEHQFEIQDVKLK
jgi:hypothetical protein